MGKKKFNAAKKKKNDSQVADPEEPSEAVSSMVPNSCENGTTAQENNTETCDMSPITENSILFQKCTHLRKGLNAGAIQKLLKGAPSLSVLCDKCEEIDFVDPDAGVFWMCLQCGFKGCGRYSTHRHALEHANVSRSTAHNVVANLETFQIWCYTCDDEVDISAAQRSVHVLVRDLKLACTKKDDPPEQTEVTSKTPPPAEIDTNKKPKSKKASEPENYFRIKGLRNLGNTCFFNSVVQSLMQARPLERILAEKVCCENVIMTFDPSTSDDKNELQYPPLTLELFSEPGTLSRALHEVYIAFNSESDKNCPVFTPSQLFDQVCRNAPRFKGYQQQDSHELLRFLLDGLKNEETKRRRKALLDKVQVKNVPKNGEGMKEKLKNKLKAYDKSADVTCVEQVFGGQLVQCIMCLQCKHVSIRFESFLDMSLSIGNSARSTRSRHNLGKDHDIITKTSTKSNYALKKERKASRRSAHAKKTKSAPVENGKTEAVEDDEATDELCERLDNVSLETNNNPETLNGSKESDGTNDDCDLSPENNSTLLDAQPGSADSFNGKPVSQQNGTLLLHENEKVVSADIDDSESEAEEDESCPVANVAVSAEGDDKWQKFMTPLNSAFHRSSSSCHLYDCLGEFMTTERLEDNNKFGCENCYHKSAKKKKATASGDVVENSKTPSANKVYTEALKQYLIYEPPSVLTLHLKRFGQFHSLFRKVSTHVEFPVILDLAPFCSIDCKRKPKNGQNGIFYELFGLVSHSGALSGGHYVAYVKVREKSAETATTVTSDDAEKEVIVKPSAGQWYYVSDSSVSRVDECKVLAQEAYLLFYERICIL